MRKFFLKGLVVALMMLVMTTNCFAGDVNGDGKIGLPEAINGLRGATGLSVVSGENTIITPETKLVAPHLGWAVYLWGEDGNDLGSIGVDGSSPKAGKIVSVTIHQGQEPETPSYDLYDLNEDGVVDNKDIELISGTWNCKLNKDCYKPFYDFDSDGIITVLDIMAVVNNAESFEEEALKEVKKRAMEKRSSLSNAD